ncbi:hypothetical protein [Dokdonella sp.]|uniref:hypothetical protein n=1 Tax=Dokdonella sp. TaxID=2291710 RepID=UPI003BB01547
MYLIAYPGMSPDDQRFDPGSNQGCAISVVDDFAGGAQFLTELGRYKRLQFNAGGGKRRVVHHHALFGFAFICMVGAAFLVGGFGLGLSLVNTNIALLG